MRLSAKSEYACLAIIDLCENADKELCTISSIAESKNIPKKFLEQILLVLGRNGYVRSRKGSRGGYRLAKSASKISIAEIIRLMDGALAPVESVSKYFYEPTAIEKNKEIMQLFREIRNYVSKKLETTSFADLTCNKNK